MKTNLHRPHTQSTHSLQQKIRYLLTFAFALLTGIAFAQISSFPHVTDFESQPNCPTECGSVCALDTDWKNGDQVGFPADVNWTADVGGTSSAVTGPSVDHTLGTSAGRYIYAETSCNDTGYPNSTFDLYSPQYDFTALANPILLFWYHLFGDTSGDIQVDVSTDNWLSSTQLTAPFTDNVDEWQQLVVGLSAYAGMSDVRLRIRYTSGTSFTGDAALDDIQVVDGVNPNLALTELSLVAPACTLTDVETVQFELTNAGFIDLPMGTNYDITVSVNGTVQGTLTQTLAAPLLIGTSIVETYGSSIDLAAAGDYTITATISLINDTNSLDDTASFDITNAGEISLPYLEDFEAGGLGWEAVNIANSTWELGTPANDVINSAASGDNAWITNATGTYNSNENGYVQSPCFDLSETCGDPEMTVSIWWEAEFSWDGMVVQSSIDEGDSWQNIGAFGDPDDNWYTDNTIDGAPGGQQEGWTGRDGTGTSGGSNGWVTAAHELTGLGGNSNVVLRFAFASDGSVTDNGAAFDDFSITNNKAVTITDISTTDETCAGASDGTVTVTATTECGTLSYSSDGGTTYETMNVLTGLSPGENIILVKNDMNDYTVSQTVTIEEGAQCGLEIEDPCTCLNNASTINQDTGTGGDDGGFSETVTISGTAGPLLPGLTFTVVAATGVLDAGNVPAVGTPQAGVPVATDGSVTLTYDPAAGQYNIDFVHVDDIGYSITIEGPNAVGAAGNVMLSIGNKCTYPNPVIALDGNPLANDEICPNAAAFTVEALSNVIPEGLSFTINGNPGSEFNPSTLGVGTHTVVMTFDAAADGNGGISPDGGTTAAAPGCIQTVTKTIVVDDNVAPVAICPTITPVVMLDADGNGTLAPNALAGGNSTDNCNVVVETSPETMFTCASVGTQQVNLTATDATNMLTDVIQCAVTIEDPILPTIVCPAVAPVVMLDAMGNGTLAANALVGNSTDACGIASETSPETTFVCGNVGTQMVTLTAVDVNMNSNSAQCEVTIENNVPPMANCQDITVQLDADGEVVITPEQIDDASFSACGIASLVLDVNSFVCEDPLLPQTVTLTVTDVDGNVADCTAEVTIEDVTPPMANCQDVTIILDENGTASTTAEDINDNSTDACGIGSISLNITEFDCSNVGANGVNLTVIDVNDNEDMCAATVTVLDETPAEIQCRQPISTVNTPGFCGKQDLTVLEPFSVYDNCGAENVTFVRWPAGNDFDIGTTTLSWTATDANGNISTCESLVIVEDNELPMISSCNTAIDFVDPGSCFAQVTVYADVFDNCGIASVEGLGTFTLPYGSYANPITVTDVNGNVMVHDFMIYIHDDFSPEFQNCPEETIVLQAGADGNANYPAQTPVATDNCGVPTITNDLPEDGLPMGSNVVTFTAEDAYGNWTNCVVNVEVTGGISLHPVSDIESSLAEDETTQTIAWNALNAGTVCELCEETSLEGFRYVGTWWGHQYFLADESSLTREEANLIAEGYDAYLAVINDVAENNYLTEALDAEIRSAWIGLMPTLVDEEWTFAWDNGDALNFEALAFEEVTAETRIILGNDGTWKAATMEEDKYFLIERPCVDFSQTGPIYTPEVEEGEEEIPGVLLRSGDVWPQGEYEVTYALTDMCGNEAVMNFDVDVLPELAEYCTTEGVDNSIWVEKIVFHDLTNESENNEGYADFTEEATTMNIGDGVILVNMQAGGNEAEDMLYWNIYMDTNADGDFFDAGEMLYQAASREDIETNLSLPVVSLENARLRVMVSRYAFAAPCGDTYVGEIEDYMLNLLIPEDYARAACGVNVAGLNGERTGYNVDLDWTVNSICPIESYKIEYSTDGINFEAVTQINETNFTDEVYTKDYTTILPSVIGTVIYRIKVKIADQPSFYTNSVNFRMNGKPNTPILYPNPADTYVSVALGEYVGQTGTVVIYDNLGKVRLTQRFDESTGDNMTLNLQRFIDGIYHVSIEAEGKRMQTARLVIDKLYGWKPNK